jgi:hypothetical protein
MFVCCHRGNCNGVPDCKCSCSGCLDEWDRFSFVPTPHDDTCDCDNCCGDDVDHDEEADDEHPCSQCGSVNCTGTCVEEEIEAQDNSSDSSKGAK